MKIANAIALLGQAAICANGFPCTMHKWQNIAEPMQRRKKKYIYLRENETNYADINDSHPSIGL